MALASLSLLQLVMQNELAAAQVPVDLCSWGNKI